MTEKILSNYSGGSGKKTTKKKGGSLSKLGGTNRLKKADTTPIVRTEITEVSSSRPGSDSDGCVHFLLMSFK